MIVGLAGSALAETSTTTAAVPATGSTTAEVVAPSDQKIIAGIDVRPSFDPAPGVFRTENALELGYQFAPARSLSYVQFVTTNIHTPGEELGLNPSIDQGYLRGVVGKILTDESNGLSFGYSNRLYVPTASFDRDAGVISSFRNYFNLTKKFNDTVSVTLSEIPIFKLNARGGTGFGETGRANPVFENRVYLTTDIQITDKLSFSMPVMFHQTRFADYRIDAKNNASWKFFVWTYPEITYALTSGTSVGLAYYSANLIQADLSGLDMEKGLTNGTVQLAFTSYL